MMAATCPATSTAYGPCRHQRGHIGAHESEGGKQWLSQPKRTIYTGDSGSDDQFHILGYEPDGSRRD